MSNLRYGENPSERVDIFMVRVCTAHALRIGGQSGGNFLRHHKNQ